MESNQEYWESYKESVIKELAINEISIAKASELELDKLTDDEVAEIDEQFNSTMDSVKSYVEFIAQSAVDSDASLNYDEEFQKAMDEYYNAIV